MSSSAGQQSRRKASTGGKDQTRLRIEKMEAEREERRRAMAQRKEQRAAEEKANLEAGNPGDVDFIGMVKSWREEHAHQARPIVDHNQEDGWYPNLCICVRKRPTSEKERAKKDHDSVTVLNPTVTIHSAKLRVDGITKYLDHQPFQLDYAFDEVCETSDIYQTTARPLLEFACQGTGGRATIFAYGQTGSGKTYTMSGIQSYLVQDLFHLLEQYDDAEFDDENVCTMDNCRIVISFFEMYGGSIQDLLNQRQRLKVLEDGKGEVVVAGLQERPADTPEALMALLEEGNQARTTHTTEANDESSRSHAICQIMLRDLKTDKMRGKLSLVDLAGSERGTDTKSHNSQRRAESADINTSLLALKECIRALDRRGNASNNGGGSGGASKETHVPYRGSKLTLILKDCFTSPNAMTTMIATVSPGASATDHSLNTLRYADRIKEQKVGGNKRTSTIGAHSGMIRLKRRLHVEPSSPPRTQKVSPQMEETDDGLEVYKTVSTEEAELQQTVDALMEQEEEILGLHMAHITENAELLSEEGKLLQHIQYDAQPQDDMDEYMDALESVLDRKEEMILNLQEQLAIFRANIHMEEDLRSRVAGGRGVTTQPEGLGERFQV